MEILILVLHVAAALGIVGLVLLQHGKGADVGAAFGSGASGSVFGSTGSANFLSRATAILAAVFFLTSLGLTYYSGSKAQSGKGLMAKEKSAVPDKSLPAQIPPTAPAKADPAAAPAPSAPPPDTKSKAQDVPK